MIRLAHIALGALLVAVALVSYGAKEEVRARRAELADLKEESARIRNQIETLEAEWRHLSSPDALRALAVRVYGEEAFRSPDGAELRPWTAEQLLDLNAPVERPSLQSELPTGSLDDEQ